MSTKCTLMSLECGDSSMVVLHLNTGYDESFFQLKNNMILSRKKARTRPWKTYWRHQSIPNCRLVTTKESSTERIYDITYHISSSPCYSEDIHTKITLWYHSKESWPKSTKVQLLRWHGILWTDSRHIAGVQFTCFTSTKSQIFLVTKYK
jgi:hypothetical protein